MTSRRSLNIVHEHLIELPPLPPDDAQSLFIARGHAAPASRWAAVNKADVAEVCRQLEGVPLAPEIAASFVGVLSPRQMLGRLDDRLRWLVARDPSPPRRQQALRAVIDWSHRLLSSEHRAVFAAGFPAEAAEAVAANRDLYVLSGLLELCDQSLLHVDNINEGLQSERLSMLESVRQYAAEQTLARARPLFEGVDLITLSACDTGLGSGGAETNNANAATGAEIDSFGALAQQHGSRAMLASLWPVADRGTLLLMRRFYRERVQNRALTKAEALRRAQLSFLRGSAPPQVLAAASKSTASRGIRPDEGAPGSKSSQANAPFAHPYFWAPFVLMGNWR